MRRREGWEKGSKMAERQGGRRQGSRGKQGDNEDGGGINNIHVHVQYMYVHTCIVCIHQKL